jgi:hypothetical protein
LHHKCDAWFMPTLFGGMCRFHLQGEELVQTGIWP